jgi:MoCo/4Fe-4S cofactor protein with predicted Tat translocation signal
MSSLNNDRLRGQAYWRSLNDLADTAEFREFVYREFPAGATELLHSSERRSFLKVMGASLALAGMGLAGCRRWPTEQIRPYAARPEHRIPGVNEHYATMMELSGVAMGLLATSADGRPIKIDGNPDHPFSRGRSDVFAQASILDLYDPDRSTMVRHDGKDSNWSQFMQWAQGKRRSARASRGGAGNGIAVLCEATNSPSMHAMRRNLNVIWPNGRFRWYEYDPVGNDPECAGLTAAFGRPMRPQYRFDKAKVVVTLDADFLGRHPAAVRSANDFATNRRPAPDGQMSRLYAFEGQVSLTGANADHRVSLRSSDVAVIAAHMLSKVMENRPADVQTLADQLPSLHTSMGTDLPDLLEAMMDELRQYARTESIVMAGPTQPAEVHYMCALINQLLGNLGHTVRYTPRDPELANDPDKNWTTYSEAIQRLVLDIDNGDVQTLVIIGGNPVYDAPADLHFAEVLATVNDTVHLSHYLDETSQACTWHLPRTHYLEAWSDGRAYDGTITIGQPLIMPLADRRSPLEVLAMFTDQPERTSEEIVRSRFNETTGMANADQRWRRALHDGVLAGSALSPEDPAVDQRHINQYAATLLNDWQALDRNAVELVFQIDGSTYDGRFANNGWMQELPDTITKLTWDNALCVSVAMARSMGLDFGDMVSLTVDGQSMTLPVVIIPGVDDHTVTLPLGYGRAFEGRICTGAGFNAYELRKTDGMWVRRGVTIEKTGETYPLAMTQDHHAIDTEGVAGEGIQRRLGGLYRETTKTEFRKHPDFVKHAVHVPHRLSMFEESLPHHAADAPYQWGMSVDLSTCIGCNACVVACQAENNIPVVGKDQVLRGRELHWMRIDRYYKFKPRTDDAGHASGWDETKLDAYALQPVTCHALRERAVRAGVPGRGDGARQARGAERDGVQPLHRHAVLLEQLPVQGAPVQLLRLPPARPASRTAGHAAAGGSELLHREAGHAQRTAAVAVQSGSHGAGARRDGEVHVLHAADRRGEDRGEERVGADESG